MTSHSKIGFDPYVREYQPHSTAAAAWTINDYFMLLRRRRWLIAAITSLIFFFVAAYVFLATPLYTSYLEMVFEQKPDNVINFQAILIESLQDEGALLGEIEILKSRKLAARAIKKLSLDTDPEFNLDLREKGLLARARTMIAEHFGLTDDYGLPESQRGELVEQRIVDEFLKHLNVSSTGRSRVVEVAFTSESPAKAMKIANAYVEQYLEMQFERSFEVSRRASDWLTGQISDLRSRVEEADRTIAAYRASHGLLQGQQNEPLINKEISDLSVRLTEASMDRIKAEATLAQVRRAVSSRDVDAISKVLDSTLVQRFREQELELERREAELSKDLGPRHPRTIQLEAAKNRFQAAVEAEVEKLVRSLNNEVTVAVEREKALSKGLNLTKAELASADQALAGLSALERVAASDKLLLEKFQTARSELAAKETASLQNATGYVMSPAVIPTKPSYPMKVLMLAGGLIAGLLLASVLAFILERSDTTFRNAPQVEAATGRPVLSLVPAIRSTNKLKDVSIQIVSQPNSRFTEAIRRICTCTLLAHPGSKRPFSLLFLSAHTGEGKTTIALSTARLIAWQTGSRVLLIDADLRRSEVSKRLGLEDGPGLAGVLAGRYSLSSATRQDPISPLRLLIGGKEITQSLVSFPRDKFETLIATAKKEYDLVVIDSPPLFALSDPQILTAIADATVLIVRWGRTPKKAVTYALDLLSRASGNIVGIVLSNVRLKALAQYGEGDSGYCGKEEDRYYTTL